MKNKKQAIRPILKETFIGKLLNPLSDEAGKDLKSAYISTKKKVKGWIESRNKENIAEHYKKAKEKIGCEELFNATKVNLKDFGLLTQWAEEAGEIDPDEETLAGLWQDLLLKIRNKNPLAKKLIEILKKLNPKEAELLIRIRSAKIPKYLGFVCRNDEDNYHIKQLITLGVIEKKLSFILYFYLSLFISLGLATFALVSIYALQFERLGIDFYNGSIILTVFLFLLLLLVIYILSSPRLSYINRKVYSYRLSYLGEEMTKGIDLNFVNKEFDKEKSENSRQEE